MPRTSSITFALSKIAELAGSRAPACERLERVLGVAREAIAADVLSVVSIGATSGEASTWQSFDSSPIPRDQLIQETAAAFDDNGDRAEGPAIIRLPEIDGSRAAIVVHGAEDTDLLTAASGYIALLVENASLEQLVARSQETANARLRETAALYDIGQAIDPADIQQVLDLIVQRAASVMDAQTCSLMLRDQRDGSLVIRASFGLADDIVKGTRIGLGEGIAGRVLETGQPMIIGDISTDPRFRDTARPRAGVVGSMCVPLKNEDGSIHGVLSIRRHEPKSKFVDDDLKVFGVFATHAALAISNAQLYSRLHRKVQEMSTISDVMQAINSTLDLTHVLDQIVESITEVVGFDRCCVYLLDSRTGDFIAGARKGYAEGMRIPDPVKPGEGVIGLAAKEQIPIFSQGSPVEGEDVGQNAEYLAAPIMVRGQCIGIVVVDNCLLHRSMEPEHVELLSTFVSQAGIAVENARLYEAMEEKYAELNVLYEHSKSISAAYGLENAAEMLVNAAAKAVKCDGAGLLLLDTRRGHMHVQAAAGSIGDRIGEIEGACREDSCVNYVRDLRAPLLLSGDSPERKNGQTSDLLDLLAPGHSSLLLAPLVTEDTTIGVLAMHRDRPNEFNSAELKLISIVTTHAATVLKNAISYELRMRQKVLELTALYEFSKKISSAASLDEALDSILAIVADLVDYDESFVYAIDPDQGVASVKAARFRGLPPDGAAASPPEEPLDGGSMISWAITERKALVSPDISRDTRFSSARARSQDVRSLMSIPLIVQDEVVGVLNIHSYSPNQYSEDDVRVVSIIASQGAAIYKELEALSALTSYTDNILSSIAAGVVTLGSDGAVLTWNTAAEKIAGVTAAEVDGLSFPDVVGLLGISEEDRQRLQDAIGTVYATGETYQAYKMSLHPQARDEVNVNLSISQLLNSAGEQLGLVLIFEDITSQIKMENEVRRMGELAAIGQLAASIAHELRNPLSSIKGAAQFLQKEYEDHPSIVEFLGIIIEEVNGLNKLTTEFLDFARPLQLELKPCSMNRVVEKTLQLMSVHITDNNVVVKDNLDPVAPEIQADSKQIEQVLRNIILNALQAMPEGGLLTVETGPAFSDGVYVLVSDTGIGIAEDKLDRIFQPFVTTKTKGTGLGLSIVHKIVENHGGRIEVISAENNGSTFKVTLPRNGAVSPVMAEVDQTMDRRTSGQLRRS